MPTFHRNLPDALEYAKKHQEKYLIAVMVAEFIGLNDSRIYVLIPHRNIDQVKGCELYFPTPPGEPIITNPQSRRGHSNPKRHAIGGTGRHIGLHCPGCNRPNTNGLCPDCYTAQTKNALELLRQQELMRQIHKEQER